MNSYSQTIHQASQAVRQQCAAPIHSAIILGSGLSDLAFNDFDTLCTLNYSDISGIPQPTVPSHTGQLHLLRHDERVIAVCAGRPHLYEGFNAQQVALLIYMLKQLGAQNVIISNAAGALNGDYTPGDIMLIDDHINVTGHNPLIGQDNSLGAAFTDMSNAYDRELRTLTQSLATSLNIDYHTGIYAGVLGPSLETSAERRMLRQLGADAVGMSTVIETIAANHCGMRVVGISAITNNATGDADQQTDSVEEVLKYAAIAGEKIAPLAQRLLLEF